MIFESFVIYFWPKLGNLIKLLERPKTLTLSPFSPKFGNFLPETSGHTCAYERTGPSLAKMC